MGEVVPFKRKPVIDGDEPYLVMRFDGLCNIMRVSDIRDLAQGKASLAEFEDCENIARMLAFAIMESIDGPN